MCHTSAVYRRTAREARSCRADFDFPQVANRYTRHLFFHFPEGWFAYSSQSGNCTSILFALSRNCSPCSSIQFFTNKHNVISFSLWIKKSSLFRNIFVIDRIKNFKGRKARLSCGKNPLLRRRNFLRVKIKGKDIARLQSNSLIWMQPPVRNASGFPRLQSRAIWKIA